MQRDFTYIDDIAPRSLRELLEKVPESDPQWRSDKPDPATSYAPYKIYNIGNNNPVELLHFINIIEEALGRKAEKKMLPMQPGDVPATYADVDDLIKAVDFKPGTPLETGIRNFISWYLDYYQP